MCVQKVPGVLASVRPGVRGVHTRRDAGGGYQSGAQAARLLRDCTLLVMQLGHVSQGWTSPRTSTTRLYSRSKRKQNSSHQTRKRSPLSTVVFFKQLLLTKLPIELTVQKKCLESSAMLQSRH